MIRIALADDHQLVLDGLKALIRTQDDFEIVVEANDGRRLLQLLETVDVDLAMGRH